MPTHSKQPKAEWEQYKEGVGATADAHRKSMRVVDRSVNATYNAIARGCPSHNTYKPKHAKNANAEGGNSYGPVRRRTRLAVSGTRLAIAAQGEYAAALRRENDHRHEAGMASDDRLGNPTLVPVSITPGAALAINKILCGVANEITYVANSMHKSIDNKKKRVSSRVISHAAASVTSRVLHGTSPMEGVAPHTKSQRRSAKTKAVATDAPEEESVAVD